MRLLLPRTPTIVDVWAVLGDRVRQRVEDYRTLGEPALRIRWASRLAARLSGYQDEYVVSAAWVEARPGWDVRCTCDRRLPCSHVGALLTAYAEAPGSFVAWERLYPALPAEAAWEWACSAAFPWDLVDGVSGWWSEPPPSEASKPWTVGARPTPGDWARWLGSLHAAWWDRDNFREALAAAVAEWALTHPGVRAMEPWIRLGPVLPDWSLDALWRSGHGGSAEVEALLFRTWWDERAAAHRDPGVHARWRVRNATAHAADWLACHRPRDEAVAVWLAIQDMDRDRVYRARWFFRQGWWSMARDCLTTGPDPTDAETLQERLRLLAALEPGADGPPASEP